MTPSPYETILRERRKPYADLLSMMRFLIVLTAIFLCIMIVFTEIFVGVRVSQRSMEPTLQNGDYLFVDRTVDPQRGDIIVIWNPTSSEYVIKRLIGLPGDTIYADGGTLYRTDAGTEEAYVVEEPYLVEDWKEDIAPVVVPEGEVYVMGDHRSMSNDSRKPSFGTLDMDGLLGVVTDWSLENKEFLTKIFGIFYARSV